MQQLNNSLKLIIYRFVVENWLGTREKVERE